MTERLHVVCVQETLQRRFLHNTSIVRCIIVELAGFVNTNFISTFSNIELSGTHTVK